MARQNRKYGAGRYSRNSRGTNRSDSRAGGRPASPQKPGKGKPGEQQPEEQPWQQRRSGIGNKLGWIVAGALVFIFLIILILFVVFPQPSDPDATRDARLLELVDVDHWPGAVVGPQPSTGGDAGPDYARAVSLYRAHRRELDDACYHLDDIRTGEHQLPDSTLRLMEQVHQAVANGARKSDIRFVLAHTAAFDVSAKYAPGIDVRMVYEVLKALFLMYEHKMGKHEQAVQVAHDTFVFGRHLMKDRGHINIVLCGLEIQLQVLGWFQGLEEQGSPAADEADRTIYRYKASLDKVRFHYKKKMEILYNTKPHPGDVLNIAENDKDPAWRAQGILMLGVIKHTAGRRGDRRYTRKLIDRYLDSAEPRFASAAKAADRFTEQDFEQYRIPDLYQQPNWPPGVLEHYYGPATPAGMLFRDE
jgi:hypothetical protein